MHKLKKSLELLQIFWRKPTFNAILAGGKSRCPEGFNQKSNLEVGSSLSSTEAERPEGI